MTKTVTIHYEDADLDRIFSDLSKNNVTKIDAEIPVEWLMNEDTKVKNVQLLVAAAEKYGVEIVNLIGGNRLSLAKASPGHDTNKKLLSFIGLTSVLTVGLVIGGVVVSKRAYTAQELTDSKDNTAESSGNNVAPTVIPEPTPMLERSDLTIRVLNGSGVRGAASRAAEKFEKLGYTIVKIGNADRKDYEKSELRLKPVSEVYRDLFTEDTEDLFVSVAGPALGENDSAGAEFTVGKR